MIPIATAANTRKKIIENKMRPLKRVKIFPKKPEAVVLSGLFKPSLTASLIDLVKSFMVFFIFDYLTPTPLLKERGEMN